MPVKSLCEMWFEKPLLKTHCRSRERSSDSGEERLKDLCCRDKERQHILREERSEDCNRVGS